MLKKLIVTGAAAGLLLVSAAGAFAHGEHDQKLPTFNFSLSNVGSVSNDVSSNANTGYNGLSGGSVKNSGITTGDATAGSTVSTNLNVNQFDCGCVLGLSGFDGNINFGVSNVGSVSNDVSSNANTGYNWLSGTGGSNHHEGWGSHGSSNGVSGSWITTGDAVAGSVVSNFVNTNLFGSTGN